MDDHLPDTEGWFHIYACCLARLLGVNHNTNIAYQWIRTKSLKRSVALAFVFYINKYTLHSSMSRVMTWCWWASGFKTWCWWLIVEDELKVISTSIATLQKGKVHRGPLTYHKFVLHLINLSVFPPFFFCCYLILLLTPQVFLF